VFGGVIKDGLLLPLQIAMKLVFVRDIHDRAPIKMTVRMFVKDIYDGVSDGKGVENACQRHL